MKKAQIFSLDAFVSIMGVTVILGLVTTQFTLMFDQYNENVFERLEMISSDMNNIGVSRVMTHLFSDGATKTAIIDMSKMTSEFQPFLASSLGDKYSAEVLAFDRKFTINNGCSGDILKATNRRLAIDYNSKQVSWVELTVCYIE